MKRSTNMMLPKRVEARDGVRSLLERIAAGAALAALAEHPLAAGRLGMRRRSPPPASRP